MQQTVIQDAFSVGEKASKRWSVTVNTKCMAVGIKQILKGSIVTKRAQRAAARIPAHIFLINTLKSLHSFLTVTLFHSPEKTMAVTPFSASLQP